MANPTATLHTSEGDIKIELFADDAPQTVTNFATLAQDGYFDGTKFHRVIAEFMAQAGDPLTKDDSKKRRWGTGGPGYAIEDEFALEDDSISNKLPTEKGLKHTFDGPGILAMANTGQPRTGGSQFFITLAPTPHLDGRHPIFGRVKDGQKVVEAIGATDTDNHDRPKSAITIEGIDIDGELPGVELEKY